MTKPDPEIAAQSIGAVERDTGLGKDTLRVWERRYGFPMPQRDGNGERLYASDDVAKLRLLKRLIDRGHRPGKIIGLQSEELRQLLQAPQDAAGALPELPAELQVYLELCRLHRAEDLRRLLAQALMREGLQQFVLKIAAPLTHAVGDYWESGRFEVHEEHLYTEVMQNVLRAGIASLPLPASTALARPRILLTTFPQEQHALGLLMAEAMFAIEGASCISLGPQTPIPDIAIAARTCHVVALSFSSALSGHLVLDGLQELSALLPADVEIWAGGASSALARCTLPSFKRLSLMSAAVQLAQWRRAHPPQP